MTSRQLNYREIFWLWLPLALSWVMMSVATPIVNAGVSRLPNPTINLAASGLTMDIAVLVESPIIMILSASVSLVRSRESFFLLRRFVTHLTLFLTGLALLVYFTPVYDWLFLNVMGVSPEIAQAAHPALQFMTLWPMAIGWRRLFQGILILNGRTKQVSFGTVWRLMALTVTVMIGMAIGTIPGAVITGMAMVASVIVEMLVIAWWTLPLVREKVMLIPHDPENVAPLSYGRFLRFYVPLAGTDIMRVVSRPVTTAGVARIANATLSLAAWPVALGLSSLLSSAVMALQEVTLALVRDEKSHRQLAIFSFTTGAVFSGLLALLTFTPLADVYFLRLQGVPIDVEILATPANWIMVPLPLLFAGRNYLRGVLIWRRQSALVQSSMSINLLTLVVLLIVGVWNGVIPGAIVAAWATLGALVAEMIALWWMSGRAAFVERATKPSEVV